jgi:hypothetical protein
MMLHPRRNRCRLIGGERTVAALPLGHCGQTTANDEGASIGLRHPGRHADPIVVGGFDDAFAKAMWVAGEIYESDALWCGWLHDHDGVVVRLDQSEDVAAKVCEWAPLVKS